MPSEAPALCDWRCARSSGDERGVHSYDLSARAIKPSPANSEFWATSVREFVPNGDVMVRNAPLRFIVALAYQRDTQYHTVLLVGSAPAPAEVRVIDSVRAPTEN